MSSRWSKLRLATPEWSWVKVEGKNNPITGQHVELKVATGS